MLEWFQSWDSWTWAQPSTASIIPSYSNGWRFPSASTRLHWRGFHRISQTGSAEFGIMASSLNYRKSTAACHRDRSLDRFSSHCIHRESSHSSTIIISKYTVTPTICRFINIVCPGTWIRWACDWRGVLRKSRSGCQATGFVWMSRRRNFSGWDRPDDSTATQVQSKSQTASSRHQRPFGAWALWLIQRWLSMSTSPVWPGHATTIWDNWGLLDDPSRLIRATLWSGLWFCPGSTIATDYSGVRQTRSWISSTGSCEHLLGSSCKSRSTIR